MTYYICYRCLTVNKKSELKKSGKLKKMSVEASRAHLTCKNCKCRTFISVEGEDFNDRMGKED